MKKKTEKLIRETHRASVDEFEIAKRNQEVASKELEELRLISADIHRIISELAARQSLRVTSLESGRGAASRRGGSPSARCGGRGARHRGRA